MKIKCSFCGEEFDTNGDTLLLRSSVSDDIFICKNCVTICNEALGIKESQRYINDDPFDDEEVFYDDYDDNYNDDNILDIQLKDYKPSAIKSFLDDYIIDQNNAKEVLSVAMYNHIKRIKYNNDKNNKIKIKKSNVLLLGPSGCGKTLFVETLAKKLDLPYSIADATSLTEAGYVGNDVETILQQLIENANGDISKAEKGIVFIDEIDKLGRKGENLSITRDVSGEGVQQALLKMIEGSVVSVPMSGNRRHPNAECYKIDTSNILFICGGAFENIDKIIKERVFVKSKIGFNVDDKNKSDKKMGYNDLIDKVTTEDIIKFGIMPELLGRLPIICTLKQLTRDALVKILTEPVDSIVNQYKELFLLDGVELKIDKHCLNDIADLAIKMKTGARSLKTILEKMLTKYMYELPDQDIEEIIFSSGCINGKKKPIIKKKEAV